MLNERRARDNDELAIGAANLLLRVGLIALAIVAPVAAVIHRRPLLVLMPIGAVLVIIGSRMSPRRRVRTLDRIRRAILSPLGLTTLALVFWAGLSLAWTPFPILALDRFFKTAGTVLVALAALGGLPNRLRVSNANLLPIGVAAVAAGVIGAAVLAPGFVGANDPEVGTAQRATIGAIVLLWPALSALATRDRIAIAGALAIVVAIAAVAVWVPIAVAALIIAMIAFVLACARPARAGMILGCVAAALVMAAPAIPLIVDGLFGSRIDAMGPFGIFPAWADSVRTEGVRLLTGHGFDATARAVLAGRIDANAPRGLLFEVWYELGVVGAAATAALAYFAFEAAGRSREGIAPFLLAALACIVSLCVAGLALSQLWWLTLLCDAAICFGVATRGQYRSERVSARVVAAERLDF